MKKENLEPKKPQEPQTLCPFNNLEREKEQRQREEEHERKALLQKFPKRPKEKEQQNWKESTESCDYLRHPCRPMPVHTTKTRSVLDPALRNWPPVRKPDGKSIFPAWSPMEDHVPSFFSCHGQTKEEEVDITGFSQPATKHFGQDSTLMANTTDNRCDAYAYYVSQPASKTFALGHVLSPQAQVEGPDRISKSSPQPARVRRGQDSPLSIQAPGKRSAQTPEQNWWNPAKKAKLTTLQILQQNSQKPKMRSGQPLSNTTEFGPQGPPQVTRMTDLQPPHSTSLLNTVEASPILPPALSNHVPRQPLRIVFTRLDNGQWSSRFRTSPTSLPPE
ncbi:protein FAM90A27P-like [Elephas maximus indicus]|uniref:protein FAM90A27P-like n=1 Tax=Elephas maximus indicus TaxID=99487 RepID=UPI0021165A69|nr:protein FAM90A27P-like [Elephas maximus indicus]